MSHPTRLTDPRTFGHDSALEAQGNLSGSPAKSASDFAT